MQWLHLLHYKVRYKDLCKLLLNPELLLPPLFLCPGWLCPEYQSAKLEEVWTRTAGVFEVSTIFFDIWDEYEMFAP